MSWCSLRPLRYLLSSSTRCLCVLTPSFLRRSSSCWIHVSNHLFLYTLTQGIDTVDQLHSRRSWEQVDKKERRTLFLLASSCLLSPPPSSISGLTPAHPSRLPYQHESARRLLRPSVDGLLWKSAGPLLREISGPLSCL